MNQPTSATALKKSNRGVEWVIILVAIGLIGLTGYLVYRLVVREKRTDFTRPSIVTYDDKKPRNIKIAYNKGKAVPANEDGVVLSTNDTVSLEWETKDDVKAFLYLTADKEEKVATVIEQTLKARNTVVSLTPTPTPIKAGKTNFQPVVLDDSNDEKALGTAPAITGDWVSFDSNDSYAKKHTVTLSSDIVSKYRTVLKLNEEIPADAQPKPSTTELYYYIILIDRNGNSYPYGDEALTFNETGPTQGYVLPLAQTFN